MIAHELAATAFERSPSGMLVVDDRGSIVAVNCEVERLLGYTRAELIGKGVELLVPHSRTGSHSHADMRAAYMSNATARPMGSGRDLFARHKSGNEVPVEIGLGPVEVDGKRFVLCTIVDISARRQLESHLRQTQKLEAIGTLAGGIAHDFNNILQGIVGYAELLRETAANRSDLTGDIDIILDTARRGRDLVQRILVFSRKGESARNRVKLAPLLTEVVHLLRATLPHKIDLRLHVDPQTPDVMADATELHQVLMNLASNAAHAMEGTGGTVDIQTEPILVDAAMSHAYPALHQGIHACISVSDTGCGIPPQILERIFEPFFTTKPQGKGTGLGLATVQRIVRGLGGSIEVHSREGRGTRFDVYLPSAAESRSDQQPVEDPLTSHRPCIMYVDDEERLAQLGRRLLTGAGFDVVAHSSSLEALIDFQTNPDRYALVITDNNMPHMAGLELAQSLTKLRPGLPIMMVSGNGDTVQPEELERAGICRLISKPYSFLDLRSAVAELLDASV